MSRRLLASYLTIAAIVLLALEIPLGILLARNERNDLTNRIERDAIVLASLSEEALEQNGSTTQVLSIASGYAKSSRGRVIVVRKNGDLVTDTDDPSAAVRSFASRPEIAEALTGTVATGVRYSGDLDQDFLFVAVPVARNGVVQGAVRITYSTAQIDARVHRSWWVLLGIAFVTLGVVTIVGWRFARATAVPLGRVERAAVAAGGGDLSVRAPVAGPPEVSSLAVSFNTMVARIAELVNSQEAFVADASHQLRTPLAALRLRLENLESHIDPAVNGDVEAAIGEVDRLGRLVDGLLVLARSDDPSALRVPTDVAALVRERVELWGALGDEQHVHVHAQVPHSAWVDSGPGRLEQVLDNLIENALGVSSPRSTITVAILDDPEVCTIRVRDAGPGLDADERARAFDRFWRSPTARTEGTGLGLAIVRRLVEADGGTIALDDAPDGGLDVTVSLPRPHSRTAGVT